VSRWPRPGARLAWRRLIWRFRDWRNPPPPFKQPFAAVRYEGESELPRILEYHGRYYIGVPHWEAEA
jgi:hypothetical protein